MTTEDEKPLIFIVDDNDDARYALEKILVHNGYRVLASDNGTEVVELARKEKPAVLILDVMMPLMDGIEVAKVLKRDPELRFIPILFLTARDALEDIIRGLDAGGDDYIAKPFKTEELLARLRAALRLREIYDELRTTTEKHSSLVREISQGYSFGDIIGSSSVMKSVFKLLEKVAKADSPILIVGPSGTGKELVARAVHFNSHRKMEPLVSRNCAAFSETILESELFGHVRGSFTGAVRDQKGVFEIANNGTLFLDEVGEMSPALQAKLLRVIQEGTYIPVGSTTERHSNVRIIAATNRDIPAMVESGKFREDLYYRLNVITVTLPPLSERDGDVHLLIDHFLNEAAKKGGRPKKTLSKEAMDALTGYAWPGNVRELRNEMERMLILSGDDEVLGFELLSDRLKKGISHSPYGMKPPRPGNETLKETVERVERESIESALLRNRWNRSKTSRELGISRSNLLQKIQSFGLTPPPEMGDADE